MRRVFSSSFFTPGPLAFVGWSSKQLAYCESIRAALEAKGFSVFPVNSNPASEFGATVHRDLASVPSDVVQAFILPTGDSALAAVEELARLGFKRLLIRSGKLAAAAVAKAGELGLEVTTGCPLMAYGKGLHRFHGLLVGVR
jgi:predicted CoA-binding protein